MGNLWRRIKRKFRSGNRPSESSEVANHHDSIRSKINSQTNKMLKIVMIGDSGTGKTCLVTNY